MSYRIKQVGEKYYPQYKFLGLFWINFKSGMAGYGYYDTVFWSLEEAQKCLEDNFSQEPVDKSVTIHKFEVK